MANEVLPDIKIIAGNSFNADKVQLLMNELHSGGNRDIPDPWYGAIDGYYKVYDLLNGACDALIKNYLATRVVNNSLSLQPHNNLYINHV